VPRKLKVYRTAVGFRDAYVAAPSQAAALRAWGTDKNLFARGGAEVVEDTELTEEPLSRPGEVVFRTRGSLAEQVAALGKPAVKRATQKARSVDGEDDGPALRRSSKATAATPSKPAAPPKPAPRPRPSRKDLDAALAAIDELEQAQSQAEADLRRREQDLARERREMEKRFARELAGAKREERGAREAYEAALRDWEP
jgi:hypothetical protein